MAAKPQPLWIVLSPKGKIVGASTVKQMAIDEAVAKVWNLLGWPQRGYLCKKIMVRV